MRLLVNIALIVDFFIRKAADISKIYIEWIVIKCHSTVTLENCRMPHHEIAFKAFQAQSLFES